MSRLLDSSQATLVRDLVTDVIDGEGFTAEEAIPGLVHAIIALAGSARGTDQLLDEAANLLADLGVEE